MKQIVFPKVDRRKLVWYLAAEEYVAANMETLIPASKEQGEREAFFLWQVPPTVIFGRNQVMEAEVNLDYCKNQGIEFYRRKSGGGCVYADMGNVMISYVCDLTDTPFVFARFIDRIVLALRRLGLKAERSGRNDVTIGGKKVSGAAFTLLPRGSIVHCTMMFDVSFDALEKAITPSEGKISSKGVNSVRRRVTNIKEELEAAGNPISIEAFIKHLESVLGAGSKAIELAPSALNEISQIEKEYLDPAFLQGRKHAYSIEKSARIEGVGEVKVTIDLDGQIIKSLELEGDFFHTSPAAAAEIEKAAEGKTLSLQALREAFAGKDTGIMGLSTDNLIKIIFSETIDTN